MDYNGGDQCITMHQPWASLLVYGIKRIEGRTWPCPLRGKLWIHAAGKEPDDIIIEQMEEFYRQIYAEDGVIDIKFPEYYPTSVLLGCVNVVDCVTLEQLKSWERISAGVRLEGQADFNWLCEDPQKLVIPHELRGKQKVYQLSKKIVADASRGLKVVKAPGPVPLKFPQLDPSDLAEGSLMTKSSPGLNASIAGARAAASQFKKDGVSPLNSARRTSSGPANLDKASFRFGQNTSYCNQESGREKGFYLQDKLSRYGNGGGHIDEESFGSRQDNMRVRDGVTGAINAQRSGKGEAGHDDSPSSSLSVMNASRQAPRRVAAFRAFDKAMEDLNSPPNTMGIRRRDVRSLDNLIPQKGNDAGQIDKSRAKDIHSTGIIPWKDESTLDFDQTVSSRDRDIHLSEHSTALRVENGHSIGSMERDVYLSDGSLPQKVENSLSVGSRVRHAPHHVGSCRAFDRAMGALSR